MRSAMKLFSVHTTNNKGHVMGSSVMTGTSEHNIQYALERFQEHAINMGLMIDEADLPFVHIIKLLGPA